MRLWDIRNTWGQSIPKKRTLMSKVGYIWLWMDNKSLCMLVFDWPKKQKKRLKMTKCKKYWQSNYFLNLFFFVRLLNHMKMMSCSSTKRRKGKKHIWCLVFSLSYPICFSKTLPRQTRKRVARIALTVSSSSAICWATAWVSCLTSTEIDINCWVNR